MIEKLMSEDREVEGMRATIERAIAVCQKAGEDQAGHCGTLDLYAGPLGLHIKVTTKTISILREYAAAPPVGVYAVADMARRLNPATVSLSEYIDEAVRVGDDEETDCDTFDIHRAEYKVTWPFRTVVDRLDDLLRGYFDEA